MSRLPVSRLTVWHETHPDRIEVRTGDPGEIAGHLREIGVHFTRWSLRAALPPEADQAAVLAAYADDVAALKQSGGYQTADVVRLAKGTANVEALRNKFLDEHTHSEDEVRFFVEGSGAFYLRGGGKVFQVVCAAGDLISVPANTRHWFDMGPDPRFTAIRLFTDPAGWVAAFTGDAIARQFPLYTEAA